MVAETAQILFGIVFGALLPYLMLGASSMFVALVAIAFLVPALAMLGIVLAWIGPQSQEAMAMQLIVAGILLVWLGFETSMPGARRPSRLDAAGANAHER